MTDVQISLLPARKLEKLIGDMRETDSALTDELIEAGRGREKIQDILKGTDSLSIRYRDNWQLLDRLRDELERRETFHGSSKPIKRKKA